MDPRGLKLGEDPLTPKCDFALCNQFCSLPLSTKSFNIAYHLFKSSRFTSSEYIRKIGQKYFSILTFLRRGSSWTSFCSACPWSWLFSLIVSNKHLTNFVLLWTYKEIHVQNNAFPNSIIKNMLIFQARWKLGYFPNNLIALYR